MSKSKFLASLGADARKALEKKLYERQSKTCFICCEPIDLLLHKGDLDIDHIDPLVANGLDSENNFALTHMSCNRSKGASDLRVARRIAEFEKMQAKAKEEGKRGANLGDMLERHGGAKARLKLVRDGGVVRYSLSAVDDNSIREVPVYQDKLSGMDYFFATLPIQYIHHDDVINPRTIGANIRGLIEEFLKKRPQLHVGLAWWSPDSDMDGEAPVKMFDGQHKAAAQILLGVDVLPVRVFLEPDRDVLVQANTNAGGALRQVAFDAAVMRHLGSTLYAQRVKQYQSIRGLEDSDYSFSEQDLVRFFRGEKREMAKYIIDSHRAAITHNKDNKLLEFVEWAGKGSDRPLSYSSIERTFYAVLLCKEPLESRIDEGMESGDNPRELEREQMIRLMSIFADVYFVDKWEPEIGGRRIESRIQKGEKIPELHLRAWRIAREEVLRNVVEYIRLVIMHYFAYAGKMIDEKRLLHIRLPDELWGRISAFLVNLSNLPCWIDTNLSTTVFGPKQNKDYWDRVFKTGKTPNGIPILAEPLDIPKMIQSR